MGGLPGEIAFYERYWLPRIALGKEVRRMDLRKEYFGEDFVDIMIKILTKLKPIFYCVALLYLAHSIFLALASDF